MLVRLHSILRVKICQICDERHITRPKYEKGVNKDMSTDYPKDPSSSCVCVVSRLHTFWSGPKELLWKLECTFPMLLEVAHSHAVLQGDGLVQKELVSARGPSVPRLSPEIPTNLSGENSRTIR